MHSRRHEDHMITQSPSAKVRDHHRFGIGRDSYAMSHHDTAPRVEHRSLSPRNKIQGSRRMMFSGEGRDSSMERKDYGRHLGFERSEVVHSRSPSYMQDRKNPHFVEGPAYRKYEYAEDMDYSDGKSNRSKQVYGYDHHGASSRMSREKDFHKNRSVGIDGHTVMGQKSVHPEDVMTRLSYRVSRDVVPPSNYDERLESRDPLPIASRSMDIGRSEREKFWYHESIPSDKVTAREFYKERENPTYHSKDAPYMVLSTSHSKDFVSSSQFKYAGSSSGVSRSEFPSSYRERIPFHDSGEYTRSNVKLTETVDFDTYSQRAVRDHEGSGRIMTSYLKGDYSPKRIDHDDYLYPKSQAIVNDDFIYPSNDLHRMMSRRSQLEYEYAQRDYEHRELSRRNLVHHVIDEIDQSEDSYENMRKSAVWDHPTIQKHIPSENLDTSILYGSKQSGEYLGSEYTEVEFGQKSSRDNDVSRMGMMQDSQALHIRSDYGFGRDAGPQFAKDLETERPTGKRPRAKEELATYEPSEKVHKGKYIMGEDINRHYIRKNLSSKWIAPNESEDLYDSGGEWIDEGMGVTHVSRAQGFNHNPDRKANKAYDGHDHADDFASEDWLSSKDPIPHTQKHSVRYHKPSAKYIKSNQRSSSLNWYNPHQTDRRSGIHREHKIWKWNDGYGEDENAEGDKEESEEWANHAVPEPSEDSEEFKQLVHEAFLTYSKRLNLHSGLQRRYKEQGKAGSLFCIVCGRSSSKDFLDTQRLVTHAFMSHKVGLRAHHLGLHKAICVLMGWNTCAPSDTVTWVPEVLPDAEALAQKEDLMLWPPVVVIHNISMSNNNPERQKVVPIEGVEAFLRGKGFIGGKIKVCLGKPADQSVILVKFLGTFTGIGSAERLHKYFAENKHGREEFNRKTSNCGKSSNNNWEVEMQGKLEENLLYGYLGIAEDLDRLDFNTKNWIIIKSKKEIQDLADAPVKADDR